MVVIQYGTTRVTSFLRRSLCTHATILCKRIIWMHWHPVTRQPWLAKQQIRQCICLVHEPAQAHLTSQWEWTLKAWLCSHSSLSWCSPVFHYHFQIIFIKMYLCLQRS